MRFTRYKICKMRVSLNEPKRIDKLNEEIEFRNYKDN